MQLVWWWEGERRAVHESYSPGMGDPTEDEGESGRMGLPQTISPLESALVSAVCVKQPPAVSTSPSELWLEDRIAACRRGSNCSATELSRTCWPETEHHYSSTTSTPNLQ